MDGRKTGRRRLLGVKEEEEEGWEGDQGGAVPQASPEVSPPMPRTICLWQVPEDQTVSFDILWVYDPPPSTPKAPRAKWTPQNAIFLRCMAIALHRYRGNKRPFMSH